MTTYWYRYNNWSETLHLCAYPVIKETPCGVWLEVSGPTGLTVGKRWVSRTSKKRFAHPTKEEALKSFCHRKRWQMKILKDRMRDTMLALDAAEKIHDDTY